MSTLLQVGVREYFMLSWSEKTDLVEQRRRRWDAGVRTTLSSAVIGLSPAKRITQVILMHVNHTENGQKRKVFMRLIMIQMHVLLDVDAGDGCDGASALVTDLNKYTRK